MSDWVAGWKTMALFVFSHRILLFQLTRILLYCGTLGICVRLEVSKRFGVGGWLVSLLAGWLDGWMVIADIRLVIENGWWGAQQVIKNA